MTLDNAAPRGLSCLKGFAVAAVYASHAHYVPFDFQIQAKSSVSHFYLYSGLLAYISSRSMLSKTSLYSMDAKLRHRLVSFISRDFWIVWIVFILRRCLVLTLYCHLYWLIIVQHSPALENHINPERKILLHYWNHWWNHPNGRPLSGSPHLWFLSPLALFWCVTPPVATLLYALPDLLAILIAIAAISLTPFAINLMPHTDDWETYYFSPQTHWPSYTLGLCLWRGRDSLLLRKFLQSMHISYLPLTLTVSTLVDIASFGFIWWQRHVILHPIRVENDFVDVFYRTTMYMALIVLIWSFPIASRSMVVRFASSRYWDRVAPGGVNLAIFVVQWSICAAIGPELKHESGRVLCLFTTYIVSILSELIILRPLRIILAPWFAALQGLSTSKKTMTERGLSKYSFSALLNLLRKAFTQ